METVNRRIACTPFPTTEVRTGAVGGLPVFRQRQELTRLQVVYNAEGGDAGPDYFAGDYVWVRGDVCKQPYAREVYEIEEGRPFIVIPCEVVVVVDAANAFKSVPCDEPVNECPKLHLEKE
jgi:hypothetical protein